MNLDTTCLHSESLNGEWQLRWYDGQRGENTGRMLGPSPELHRAIPAQVPGSVHLDLMQAGLLEEPNEGLNVLKARWVQENHWLYRRVFSAAAPAKGERVWLYFETLDLGAVIYLNGQEVGRHANAFRPCRVEVTQALREGENILNVDLESGLWMTAERPAAGFGMNPCDTLHKRVWLRTTQSTFSWDWSPLLLNIGIRGQVRLEFARRMRLVDSSVVTFLSPNLRDGSVRARLEVEGLAEKAFSAELHLRLEGQEVKRKVQVQPGLQILDIELPVNEPDLWWPVGHGEQPLYPVEASLSAGEESLSLRREVGFRHIEVDQAPHPQGGRWFVLHINGKAIFCKGGNLVPSDLIFARIDRERYEMLADRALEANCNLLRIWGGGLYEGDDFYELCDRKGILVWQEFIFACAKYPIYDDQFLAEVRREAVYQVRRLNSHASLVVWCGNNEMEWGAWGWGYERGVALPDYALFHLILPRILNEEDGSRFYQPSSPFSPDLVEPNADDRGDQHPWTVGFANLDFRDYRAMAPRFPNEGGFLGPTALPTMQACLKGTEGNPFTSAGGAQASFAWETHDNSIAFNTETNHTDRGLQQWLGLDIRKLTLEEFTFWAGLLQGQALEEYIRNFRRRMFDTSSAIFWMYNDVWPAVRSWTIVDVYGRRTPAFQPVKRAFQPLRVALAVEGEEVQVYGINEGEEWRGNLHYGLVRLAGGYPLQVHRRVHLAANASTLLATFPLEVWQRAGVTKAAAFARLTLGRAQLSQDVFILPFFQEMEWQPAPVSLQVRGEELILRSPGFAWRVCLDLDGELPLPDNFIDLLPGIPRRLPWNKAWGRPRVRFAGNQLPQQIAAQTAQEN